MSVRTHLTRERFDRFLRRDNADERSVLVRFMGVVQALVDGPGEDAERVAQIREALAAADAILTEFWEFER